MCATNPAVAAGAPGVCGLVAAWVTIPLSEPLEASAW